MEACNRALRYFHLLGYDQAREACFTAASTQGCCYLCHVPFSVNLPDCPCPHWFIGTARAIDGARPIFKVYGVPDVLHYLLLYVKLHRPSRSRSGTFKSIVTADSWQLQFQFKAKLWIFHIDRESPPSAIKIERRQLRTGNHDAVLIELGRNDSEFLRRFAEISGVPA